MALACGAGVVAVSELLCAIRLRWYWGLAIGVGWYDGCLFVQLGPMQMEITPQ